MRKRWWTVNLADGTRATVVGIKSREEALIAEWKATRPDLPTGGMYPVELPPYSYVI